MPARASIKYISGGVVVLFLALLAGCSASGGGGDGDKDSSSGAGGSDIHLGVPTTADGSNTVRAGRSAPVRVRVTAASGGGLVGITVNFSHTAGALSSTTDQTDANGYAEVILTADTQTDGTMIVAEIAGGLRTAARIAFVAGPPARLDLTAMPTSVNVQETSTLQAVVFDSDSRQVQGVTVSFTILTNISGAILSAATSVTDANGQASVTYTAGTFGGIDVIQASVAGLTKDASIVVTGPPGPASIELLVSSPQLASGGVDTVTLTAVVRDSNNNLLENFSVTFSADSGAIQVTRGITDATGTAEALLSTGGDRSIRTITVTAHTHTLTATNTVDVTGTTISLSGPGSIVTGQSATFSLLLQDSAGAGIGGETVSLRSTVGVTLPATVVTGTNGDQTFQVTVSAGGTYTIDATALGAVGSATFTVSDDNFTLTVANAAHDIPLNTPWNVTAHWDKNGVNQTNQPITFFITRGVFTANQTASITQNTDANGDATVAIESSTAGPAVITAQTATAGGPSAQVTIEFVTVDPASLILQAAPTTLGINEQSILTATVRDAAGNLVKGQTISFSIVTDITGGNIAPGFATTSSTGQASTVYTAGGISSAQDGVAIQACVLSDPTPPLPCNTVALTVAGQQLFVTLGTSHLINTPSPTQYAKPYSALVTDASGNAVANASVQLSLLATRYQKGFYEQSGGTPCGWVKHVTIDPLSGFTDDADAACNQEDINHNGLLDPGEDINNNGTLDPGNVAAVPSALTTDATGFAFFDVVYAREFTWVEVELEARATVVGSEGKSTARFFLPGAATDFNDCTVAPPGQISPFGIATTCACDELVSPTCPTFP